MPDTWMERGRERLDLLLTDTDHNARSPGR